MYTNAHGESLCPICSCIHRLTAPCPPVSTCMRGHSYYGKRCLACVLIEANMPRAARFYAEQMRREEPGECMEQEPTVGGAASRRPRNLVPAAFYRAFEEEPAEEPANVPTPVQPPLPALQQVLYLIESAEGNGVVGLTSRHSIAMALAAFGYQVRQVEASAIQVDGKPLYLL